MYSVPSQKCTSAAHVLHMCCTHLVGYMCWMSTYLFNSVLVMCYTCVKTTYYNNMCVQYVCILVSVLHMYQLQCTSISD